jgi:hypothetical protein
VLDDGAGSNDRNLGRVEHGDELLDVVGAQIGDAESASFELFQGDRALERARDEISPCQR